MRAYLAPTNNRTLPQVCSIRHQQICEPEMCRCNLRLAKNSCWVCNQTLQSSIFIFHLNYSQKLFLLPLGYSLQRCGFWVQRLRELRQCGIENIESNAKHCLSSMRRAGDETNRLPRLIDEDFILFSGKSGELASILTGSGSGSEI